MTPSRRRSVWLVDDSPLDLERARQALAPGYEIRTFTDGSRLLEALASQAPPDVLVVDWLMSPVSGIDVCTYLRSSPRPLSDLPVLLVTGQGEIDRVVQGLDMGANDYLSKPYAEPELLARVRALVRMRELLERAEHAETNVRRLLATAPDALVVLDALGQITFANEEAEKVTSLSQQELLGQQAEAVFPGLAVRNISAGPGEPLLPLPDVSLGNRLYAPSVRVLLWEDASRTTISLRDVTERRRAEDRRLDFYAIIAHDLRTPLSSILLRTDLILRGRHGLLKPELATDIQRVATQARSLVGMINDFLQLASFEGTGRKIQRTRVELGGLLEKVCEDFRPLLEAGELRWTHQAEAAPMEVLADEGRLEQVLSNLVGNAIKFTPPGGTITTALREHGQEVEVLVEDTGPGVDPLLAPTLFERYSTGSRASSESARGTGLGLMIVREIVEAHGGRVGVRSQKGKGSTFWLRLHREAPTPAEGQA